MSQAEEMLLALTEGEKTTYPTSASEDEIVVIGEDRVISVPSSLRKIAVQYDHNVETVTFKCPRYWDDVDMFNMIPYVNYLRPDGGTGSCPCDNKKTDTDDPSVMYFDWTLSGNVTQSYGQLKFLVCIKKADSEGNSINHWNSELCTDMYISEGLECDEYVATYPDVISNILLRLNTVEKSGTALFEGTRAQYETAYAAGKIKEGTFVIITDESDDEDSGNSDDGDSSTSVLGEAILGQMILD